MAQVNTLKKPSRKGEPPKPAHTTANLQRPPSTEKVPLQLKLSPEIRNDFKGYAGGHGMELSQLFALVWDYYKEHHG